MSTFLGWMRGQRYAPNTTRLYMKLVSRADAHCRGWGAQLSRAPVDLLAEWLNTLPPPSQRQAHSALVTYYRWKGRRPNPMVGLDKMPEPHRLPRPVPEQAFKAYRDTAISMGGIWQAFGLLITGTGCRFSEAHRAQWEQIDLLAATWRIIGKASQRRGPKHRLVALRLDSLEPLAAWQRACGNRTWVFPSPVYPGRCCSESWLRKRHAEICDHAGLPNIGPHRFRHTVATVALERTLDLRAVSELLGHVNPATTALYTKVSAERLRAVIESLPT